LLISPSTPGGFQALRAFYTSIIPKGANDSGLFYTLYFKFSVFLLDSIIFRLKQLTIMNRKEFLLNLGMGGAAVFATMTLGCMNACTSQKAVTPSGGVDFTIDLADPANAALTTNGGFLIKNQVVVAKSKSGSFVAVTQICSHQGNPNVSYISSTDSFGCSVHGATFDINGKGTNSTGSGGLTLYKTALTGNSLRVYS
jgi:cytochrome b6-f complex iron-sulfur subunit